LRHYIQILLPNQSPGGEKFSARPGRSLGPAAEHAAGGDRAEQDQHGAHQQPRLVAVDRQRQLAGGVGEPADSGWYSESIFEPSTIRGAVGQAGETAPTPTDWLRWSCTR
jgi:hypothetical protein